MSAHRRRSPFTGATETILQRNELPDLHRGGDSHAAFRILKRLVNRQNKNAFPKEGACQSFTSMVGTRQAGKGIEGSNRRSEHVGIFSLFFPHSPKREGEGRKAN